MKKMQFFVHIEQDEDWIFVGSIPSITNCYAQWDTQEEMLKNLKEVLTLCLRNLDKDLVLNTHFVWVQNLTVEYA